MQVRRTGRFAVVYRLYDPRRRAWSVALRFEGQTTKRAARRWAAERQQQQLFSNN